MNVTVIPVYMANVWMELMNTPVDVKRGMMELAVRGILMSALVALVLMEVSHSFKKLDVS